MHQRSQRPNGTSKITEIWDVQMVDTNGWSIQVLSRTIQSLGRAKFKPLPSPTQIPGPKVATPTIGISSQELVCQIAVNLHRSINKQLHWVIWQCVKTLYPW